MQHVRPALALTLLFVLVTGLAFPTAIWLIGSVAFPSQSRGSLLRDARGTIVGSALIGQSFTKPGYFHPRPSAAGTGYDAANSSGTNLGPTSAKLVSDLIELAQRYRAENGLASDTPLPADAVTRSASGLDPHISPANALLQMPRVARARKLAPERVRDLVAANLEDRSIGLFGEPRANVLRLNLALDALK